MRDDPSLDHAVDMFLRTLLGRLRSSKRTTFKMASRLLKPTIESILDQDTNQTVSAKAKITIPNPE